MTTKLEVKCEKCESLYVFFKNIPGNLTCGCGKVLIHTDEELNATFFDNMKIDGKQIHEEILE